MSIDEFSYILDEIRPFTDYIYLHVLGEPLLHPDIIDFIEYANKSDEFDIYENSFLKS